ncbi:MAG: beta strand repeat-containing protein [Steroidobacteraceae bacterium]
MKPATICRRWLAAPLGALALLTLGACNGSTVVTLTSVPSTDAFLTYRVGLVSIQVQNSNGRRAVQILPSNITVDLAQLVNLSEVVGEGTVTAGNLTEAVVTLDYSSAQIVYDDGSIDGVALTPLGASGQALGQVTLTLYLDPSNGLTIARKGSARLSLELNLAASNIVNLTQKTVTVTPLMSASASQLDTKTVRVQGPLSGVTQSSTSGSNTTGGYTSGIVPFDFGISSAGSLGITPSTVTTFEINGVPSIGAGGLTQLAALSPGTVTVSFGTLTTSTSGGTSSTGGTSGTGGTLTCADGATLTTTNGVSTCSDGSTPTTTATATATATSTSTTGTTSVSFAATQVLAGSSVEGSGFDRISGVVSARSGDTLTIEDGTLISSGGENTFIPGSAIVTIGPNTAVTQFGAGSPQGNGAPLISVGSSINAFGTAGTSSSGGVTLDASAGRVQLGPSTASGIVTAQGTSGAAATGSLTLTLVSGTLSGRSLAAFDFTGTGTSPSNDASAAAYQVNTGALDLTNATVGSPVQVSGLITPFGAAAPPTTPDFNASTLLDYTTINAALVLDWSGGTPAPFASYNSSQIVLDSLNGSIGARHEIDIGAQTVNIVGIASNPVIVPNATDTNTVYTIGHSTSGTFENFVTFSAFITQLQTELNGTTLVTGITAQGQYTTNTYTFSASTITLFLDN